MTHDLPSLAVLLRIPKKTQQEMMPGVLMLPIRDFFPNFENQGTLATAMLMHRLLPAFLGTLAALVVFFFGWIKPPMICGLNLWAAAGKGSS